MKKNAQLHILLETRLLNQLKSEAAERGISMGEYCRSRLKKRPQLDRIEHKLDKVLKKRKKS
jgi:hypothetical protein